MPSEKTQLAPLDIREDILAAPRFTAGLSFVEFENSDLHFLSSRLGARNRIGCFAPICAPLAIVDSPPANDKTPTPSMGIQERVEDFVDFF